MTKFVYKDYLPANARVVIDYTAKDKVGFSYPREWTYWKAVWSNAFPTTITFWLMLHVSLFILLVPLWILGGIVYVVYISLNPTMETITIINYTDFQHTVLPIIIGIIWFVGIPLLITLWMAIKKERISKWVPLMGYWEQWLSGHIKKTTITTSEVSENKAIIPSFKNVFLNYKAYGDFNTYLEKVEILELPFNYKIRNMWMPWKLKEEKNDSKFRAVFYFSQTPKEGRMDVEFD